MLKNVCGFLQLLEDFDRNKLTNLILKLQLNSVLNYAIIYEHQLKVQLPQHVTKMKKDPNPEKLGNADPFASGF